MDLQDLTCSDDCGDECTLYDDDEGEDSARGDDDCDYADDPERCGECLLSGEYRCSRHAPAYLAWRQEQSERAEVVEALRAVLALPEAWAGPAWYALRDQAREVLAEMREDTTAEVLPLRRGG